MNKFSIYLAGPMRSYPAFNFPAFDDAADRLRSLGNAVFNPADRDRKVGFDPAGMTGNEDLSSHGFSLRAALGADTAWICETAECVVVLPGWERSSGATAEVALAKALGLPAYELEDFITMQCSSDHHPAVNLNDPVWLGEVPPARPILERTDVGQEEFRSVGDTLRQGFTREAPGPGRVTNRDLIEEILALDDARSVRAVGEMQRAADEVRVVSDTGGAKGTKAARHDLIPPDVLDELAKHYGRGDAKYNPDGTNPRNWERGYQWSLSYGALQRHLLAFWSGEDHDPELGSPHLAAVLFHAAAMLHYQLDPDRYGRFDDRPHVVALSRRSAA